MKIKDIRGKDTTELMTSLRDLSKEYFELKFKTAAEEVGHSARFRQIRRDRARIKTVLTERANQEASKAQTAGGQA